MFHQQKMIVGRKLKLVILAYGFIKHAYTDLFLKQE